MRKMFVTFLLVLGFNYVQAISNSESLSSAYQGRTTNAFTVYVNTGTARYSTTSSSISFHTVGGLYPGTTAILLNSFTSVQDLITHLNAISATTGGAEGGIVATLVQGCYPDSVIGQLAASDGLCQAGNPATLTLSNTLGITYILPASELSWKQQYHITDCCINATFATGTCNVNIYSSTATVYQVRKETLSVSAVDGKLDISPSGEFANNENTPMRFDVISSTWITAGYINFNGYKK